MKDVKKKTSGFTLFELLVVISIIGILISMAMVSYTNAQKKARDSRAKADVKAMGDSFEQYYAANNAYAACATMALSTWKGSWPPTDPRGRTSGQTGYSYTITCDAAGGVYFCVCALLEQGNGGNASNANCPPTWLSNGAYYCSVNQQ